MLLVLKKCESSVPAQSCWTVTVTGQDLLAHSS